MADSWTFSWHTLGPWPTEHDLNTTICLSIVLDHIHPFMTLMYPLSDGCSHQDLCHKAQIVPHRFPEHTNEFTVFTWLNSVDHFWEWDICIMDVHPANLQQLCDGCNNKTNSDCKYNKAKPASVLITARQTAPIPFEKVGAAPLFNHTVWLTSDP